MSKSILNHIYPSANLWQCSSEKKPLTRFGCSIKYVITKVATRCNFKTFFFSNKNAITPQKINKIANKTIGSIAYNIDLKYTTFNSVLSSKQSNENP